MFGSNFYAEAYYAQGPFVETPLIIHTLSATVVTSASLSTKLIFTKTLSATVTTVATIARMFERTLMSVTTTVGFFSSLIIPALNIKRSSTKLLTGGNETKSLGNARWTDDLDEPTETLQITDPS